MIEYVRIDDDNEIRRQDFEVKKEDSFGLPEKRMKI